MLADGKDEGVVHGQAFALGLRDVEIVALGMGCWVSEEKFIGGVVAGMDYGDGEGDGMRVIPDRVHEAANAGVDFQDTLTFVSGEMGFDCVALLAGYPFGLGESAGDCGVAAFKPVAVGIAGVGASFYFGIAFDVRRHVELDLDELEVVDPTETGIVIDHLDVVFEVWRTGTW